MRKRGCKVALLVERQRVHVGGEDVAGYVAVFDVIDGLQIIIGTLR